MKLVSIVEGVGEPEAMRILLPRVLAHLGFSSIDTNQILKASGRGELTRSGGVEKYIKLAILEHNADCILILIDADDDCPGSKAPAFGRRIHRANPTVPIAVVCPKRMYEAWLLASMDDIAGKQLQGNSPGIRRGIRYSGNPEEERDPKKWLDDAIRRSHPGKKKKYRATRDMKSMTEHLSVTRTMSRSRSFKRLLAGLESLVKDATRGISRVTPV